MTATDIIAATTVTKVWLGLGSDPPRRGRARAFYRDGDNHQAVSLDDSKGAWFDYRDNAGGGVLDLIQRILGCDRADALRWLSKFTGMPLEDRAAIRAERRALAERREREQRELRAAEFFRLAAVSMADSILEESPETDRYASTQLLVALRTANDADLLALYCDFRAREPKLTAALEYAGERAWRRRCDALARSVNTLTGTENAA